MVTFTLEECTRAAEIEAMADVPKGKPSPEQKAKMDEQKKARLEFTAGLKEKYTLEEEVKGKMQVWGDKKIVKELLAQAELAAKAAAAGDCINLQPPSGTRDFYPDDMRLQSWLFAQFREVAREMGFQVTTVDPSN